MFRTITELTERLQNLLNVFITYSCRIMAYFVVRVYI